MNRILVAVSASVLLSTLLGAPAHSEGARSDGDARIVGGRELTSLDQNPGATGLHVKTDIPDNGGFICGSMRIGPTWVLTAKHCVEDKYTYTQVSTHTIRRSEGPRPNIVKTIKHPKRIDLALVRIEEGAPGPILTYSDNPMNIGDTIHGYGWGYVDTGANPSTILKTARGTVAALRKGRLFPDGTDIIFTPGDGLCWTGDSGSPLVDAAGVLVGVTSWSTGYGTMSGTCGYVSLAHNGTSQWIRDITGIAPGTRFPQAG